MQEQNFYRTGTCSISAEKGFLTDIYLQDPQTQKGILFLGIVDLRLGFDLAVPRRFAEALGFNPTKEKAESCRVEIDGKFMKGKVFKEDHLCCHIPFVSSSKEIHDGRTITSLILIYDGSPINDLYKDKVIIGSDLITTLAIEVKPVNDLLFKLQTCEDPFFVSWEVTEKGELIHQAGNITQ